MIFKSLWLSLLIPFAASASPRVMNGDEVKASEAIARRTVAIITVDSLGQGGICTGNILNSRVILTAAHCVHDQMKFVAVVFALRDVIRLGVDAIKAGKSTATTRIARGFRRFPGYSMYNQESADLSLITFDGGLPAGYEPARFLKRADSERLLQAGTLIQVAGYGSATEAECEHRSAPASLGTLRRATLAFLGYTEQKAKFFLHAENGRNVCQGDSGGPAYVNLNGQTYLVGVTEARPDRSNSFYTWTPREKASALLAN